MSPSETAPVIDVVRATGKLYLMSPPDIHMKLRALRNRYGPARAEQAKRMRESKLTKSDFVRLLSPDKRAQQRERFLPLEAMRRFAKYLNLTIEQLLTSLYGATVPRPATVADVRAHTGKKVQLARRVASAAVAAAALRPVDVRQSSQGEARVWDRQESSADQDYRACPTLDGTIVIETKSARIYVERRTPQDTEPLVVIVGNKRILVDFSQKGNHDVG